LDLTGAIEKALRIGDGDRFFPSFLLRVEAMEAKLLFQEPLLPPLLSPRGRRWQNLFSRFETFFRGYPDVSYNCRFKRPSILIEFFFRNIKFIERILFSLLMELDIEKPHFLILVLFPTTTISRLSLFEERFSEYLASR